MTMLQISQCTFHSGEHQTLKINELNINDNDAWAFIGANGSGKSTLGRVLAGEISPANEGLNSHYKKPVCLSFEKLSHLVEREWQRNNSDLLTEKDHPEGQLTRQIIQQEYRDEQRCQQLADHFDIESLLDRPFRVLSTGETRKALLCQALMATPDLLILDEPFDGLDVGSRQRLAELTAALAREHMTLVFILNRFEDIPEFVNHVGILAEGELVMSGNKPQVMQQALVAQLAHSETLNDLRLPEAYSVADGNKPQLSPVILRNGRVSWDGNVIIKGLDWEVKAEQHWQITGPNGAGKSTLLSLVTGDHPQGFSNDLTLFGIRRGSGETIEEIRQHIGYVSSSLHLDYRVSASVRTVIISGFFDTIGLYQTATDRHLDLTQQWLKLLGFSDQQADSPFSTLSWGQQRLVLIVRALVKHPRLLILDEPLQGLDALNRQLVRQFINKLMAEGHTQLLFVSHHAEDAPACITHRLSFIPKPEGGFHYQQDKLSSERHIA